MARDRRAVIGTGIWSEASFRALTRLQQHAYFLVYTHEGLNKCGVLDFKSRVWANRSADGDEAELRNDYAVMHTTRHVVLDEADEQILLRTYVYHDGLLTQPLVLSAMIRDYFTITSPVVKTGFLAEIRRLFDVADLEPKERAGLALTIGADPAEHDVKNAVQVAKAIGTGLAGALIDVIGRGLVEPFTEKGLPKGLTEGLREGLTKGPPNPPVNPPEKGYATSPSPSPIPTPIPVPTPAPTNSPPDDPTSDLLTEHARAYDVIPSPTALAPVRVEISRLVAEHVPADHIRAGLAVLREKSHLHPKLLAQLVVEATNPPKPRGSRNGQILDAAMQRAQAAEAGQKAIGP